VRGAILLLAFTTAGCNTEPVLTPTVLVVNQTPNIVTLFWKDTSVAALDSITTYSTFVTNAGVVFGLDSIKPDSTHCEHFTGTLSSASTRGGT
jgi:hypothetical protein